MKDYELNKEEKRIVRETIKRGILHRHAQWLDEMLNNWINANNG